jgi:hypothetical protein
VWNSKMLWQSQKLLKYKRVGCSTWTAQTGHSHSDAMLRCSPSDRPFVDHATFFVFSNVGQRTLQTFEGPKLATVMLKKKLLKNRSGLGPACAR